MVVSSYIYKQPVGMETFDANMRLDVSVFNLGEGEPSEANRPRLAKKMAMLLSC
jgi:hypothetical protein